jgi:hypothetical protein
VRSVALATRAMDFHLPIMPFLGTYPASSRRIRCFPLVRGLAVSSVASLSKARAGGAALEGTRRDSVVREINPYSNEPRRYGHQPKVAASPFFADAEVCSP